MSAYLRPFHNDPKVIERDFGDLASKYFDEGVVPGFNITIVERLSADHKEPETDQFGYLAHTPAACGVVLSKSGASKIASRALYRREVEEIYLGQEFVPPPEKELFYKSQEKLRTMAVPLEFTNEDV